MEVRWGRARGAQGVLGNSTGAWVFVGHLPRRGSGAALRDPLAFEIEGLASGASAARAFRRPCSRPVSCAVPPQAALESLNENT